MLQVQYTTTLTIKGKPIGRSENSNVIFFEGKCSDPKYKLVFLSYEVNLENSNLYFKTYKENDSVLKIYLKENNKKSRDYILMEGFDLNLKFSDDLISNLNKDNTLGAWACSEFEPVSESTGEVKADIVPFVSYDSRNYYCTKSYYYTGENVTHTIKYRSTAEYSNVPVSYDAMQYYRLTVYAKSCRYSENKNYNSDTSSALHITGLSLDQTSIPGTAWKSTDISGKVLKKGSILSAFNASVGYKLGPLSLGISIPKLFDSGSGTVKVGGTYDSYENGANGEFTRSIRTKLQNDCALTKIGHYFEVRSVLRDYKNRKGDPHILQAKWNIKITAYDINEDFYYYVDHNTIIAVK